MNVVIFLWEIDCFLSVLFQIFDFFREVRSFWKASFSFVSDVLSSDVSEDLFLLVLQCRLEFNTVCLMLLLFSQARLCLLNFCWRLPCSFFLKASFSFVSDVSSSDVSEDLFLIVLQLRLAFNTVCLILVLLLQARFCSLNFCWRLGCSFFLILRSIVVFGINLLISLSLSLSLSLCLTKWLVYFRMFQNFE